MQVQLQTDQGPRAVTVLKVGGKVVDVDLNHPFAGQTLDFAVEVVDVREASAEEIAHGHVHGPGGHHH
jgi:FKBP-type peptidyl-prolyl cis-trans isomerase SlyD